MDCFALCHYNDLFVFSLAFHVSLVLFVYMNWSGVVFVYRVYDLLVVLSLFDKLLCGRDGNVVYVIFWNNKK